MSLAESFLNTAKDMLMMSENIRRIEAHIDKIADDVHTIDRRVMKIELMVDFAKQHPRKRSPKELT